MLMIVRPVTGKFVFKNSSRRSLKKVVQNTGLIRKRHFSNNRCGNKSTEQSLCSGVKEDKKIM